MAKLRQLQIWWNEFNAKFFENRLKPIPIRITRSKRYWGHYNDPPAIFIGRHLNRTLQDYRDTLLHEMIHQFLDEQRIVEVDEHGPRFQEEYLRVCGKKYLEP